MRVEDYISVERLSTFQEITDSRLRAIALHNHTLQLGASLMSMIALLELALRNSTNSQLVSYFGDENWMLDGHTSVPLENTERAAVRKARKLAQKAAYSKLTYKQKLALDEIAFPEGVPTDATHDDRVRERQKLFEVSHGQVISQTTLHFWKKLFGPQYEALLWKPAIKRVFPDKKIKRSVIASALETVYSTRNRVAHHEPVYGERLAEVMESLEFLRNTIGARKNEEDTSFKYLSRVTYLRLQMDFESFTDAWGTLVK